MTTPGDPDRCTHWRTTSHPIPNHPWPDDTCEGPPSVVEARIERARKAYRRSTKRTDEKSLLRSELNAPGDGS